MNRMLGYWCGRPYKPTAAVTGDTFDKIGDTIMYFPNDIAANATGTAVYKCELMKVDKDSSTSAWTLGQSIYFDPTDDEFYNAVGTGRTHVGFTLEASASGTADCEIYFIGQL